MYNEAQKLRFIGSIGHTSGKNACTKIFNNSEKLELRLDTDLAEFSKQQFADFFNSMEFTSLTLSREYFTYIGRYLKWVNPDLELQITKDDVDYAGAIRRTFFKDPEDLIGELRFGVDPNQDQYPIIAMYLAWIGFEINEAIELTNNRVDLNSGVIFDKDGKVLFSHIDTEILSELREFKSTFIATRTQNQTFTVVPQTTDKFLHKMVSKNSNRGEVKRSTLTSLLSTLRNVISSKLGRQSRVSYKNAQTSGRLYRLYQAELDGLDISPSNKDKINAILCSKGDIFDNLFQYRKYKEAFGLQ